MITREQWSAGAERELSRAVGACIMPIVRREVETGIAQLWHAQDDFADAYIVTRLESNPLEWVFVAAAGRGVMHYARQMVTAGKDRKLSMRCHVVKPALARLWGRLGFVESERVLRVA